MASGDAGLVRPFSDGVVHVAKKESVVRVRSLGIPYFPAK